MCILCYMFHAVSVLWVSPRFCGMRKCDGRRGGGGATCICLRVKDFISGFYRFCTRSYVVLSPWRIEVGGNGSSKGLAAVPRDLVICHTPFSL